MRKNSVDILLLVSVILISLFGLVMIYSASYVWAEYKFNNPFKFVINQGIFFVVGVVLMMIVSHVNYDKYYDIGIKSFNDNKNMEGIINKLLNLSDEDMNKVVEYIRCL